MHEHAWERIGECWHPHAYGADGHPLFRCPCGAYAHSRRVVGLACSRSRLKTLPPVDSPVNDRAAWEAKRLDQEATR